MHPCTYYPHSAWVQGVFQYQTIPAAIHRANVYTTSWLQGPTSVYNQDGDRIQQLQQQQQQQRIADVEVVRGPVASSASSSHAEAPTVADAEAAADHAASPRSQDLTGLSCNACHSH